MLHARRTGPMLMVLLLTLLAGLVASRWALSPLGFHCYVGPAHTGDAELIREHWPHRLIEPEWFRPAPDIYVNWSLRETAVRLAAVGCVWLSLITVVFVGSQGRKRESANHSHLSDLFSASEIAARISGGISCSE